MPEKLLLADVMASGIHDVRNCLFVAESNLLKDVFNLEVAREKILEAATRLNRMLSAYHLLRHEQRLNLVPVNVGELIEDAILEAGETSHRKIVIKTHLAYSSEWLFARDEINDTLVNALQSAIKFCQRFIEIHAYVESDFLIIEVHDDGPGFAEMPIVSRPDAKGHGIGLFIAQQLARHHCRNHNGHEKHGKIQLGASPRLGGAQFTLCLP